MKFISVTIFSIIAFSLGETAIANPIDFRKTWESSKKTQLPIEFMIAVDLDGNGVKELLFTDFSFSSYRDFTFDEAQQLREQLGSTLMIIEWQRNAMNLKWEKKFPPTTRGNMKGMYFSLVSYVESIQSWRINGKNIIESVPPYFQIKWSDGSYRWIEQSGSKQTETNKLKGSWLFPFQSASCYKISFYDALPKYPSECILGMRKFESKRGLRIVTRVRKKDNESRSLLRVRKFEKGFPVEWEGTISGSAGPFLGRYKDGMNYGLLGRGLFSLNPEEQGYSLKPIEGERKIWRRVYGSKVKTGKTQNKSLFEYWGYFKGEDTNNASFGNFLRAYLNKNQTKILTEKITFPVHKQFISIGFFTPADLDDDNLDEIIFIEQTGKRKGSGEHGYEYSDIADFVRILKWNGKKYVIVWTSPPLKKRRSKILVDDVTGKGRKQLVVGTGDGKIQIWERK